MKKVYLIILVLVIVVGAAFFMDKPFDFAQGKEAKILFVGDMMFDRYIRQVGYNKGKDFVFSCKDANGMNLSNFLKNSDLVVGNLEGPITENASISMFTPPGGDGNYTFTFPTNTAKLLAENNIKLVNLGNNHIGNFGQVGIDSTKKFLSEAGVSYFGDDIYRTEIGGVNISFVSYNEFGGASAEKVAQKIKIEKEKGQKVLVYAHWGDEYVAPPERVKNVAKMFADSGADFIIGSHPHVVLENEKIGNTEVYYSLGNFIFDQYWNKEVSTGMVLELNIKKGTFNKSQVTITEHKVSLNKDGRTCPEN